MATSPTPLAPSRPDATLNQSGSDASPPVTVSASSVSVPPFRLPAWFPPLFFFALACLFLYRSTFLGDVFLPAGLLGHVAPWSQAARPESLPAWNPLRWDGIAQFYPWRHFAAESVRSGILPLWNPYQFCGTPFVANSQSAVLYPGNVLFHLLPTARAFAWSAVLHLTLGGWFTFLLLRRLNVSQSASLLGGVVYAFSAWQIAWLQLPTFLATSCWFPLLFLSIKRQALSIKQGGSTLNAQHLALNTCIVGLLLLAGHLQIAFYGLLTATLWAIALGVTQWREGKQVQAWRGLGAYGIGLILGGMLAAPQILPAMELSRVSHRAGKPTGTGYAAYTEYALTPGNLVTLALPDFFGNDSDPNNAYWGFYTKSLPGSGVVGIRHNAAETAAYVGIVPFLLGLFTLVRVRQNGRWNRRILFFGVLALLALLMALGTPINALFYFGVPGFGQSGSPARVLVVWAFAFAVLSAFGLDELRRAAPTRREIGMVLGASALLFVAALGLVALQISPSPRAAFPIPTFGDVFARLGTDWVRLALLLIGALALLIFSRCESRQSENVPPSLRETVEESDEGATVSGSFIASRLSLPLYVPLALLLVIFDLFWVGIGANPTARPEAVYPETPGIALLKQQIGHERIAPLNKLWSLTKSPPAVLPPNAGLAYGLRDMQGYDSLLTRQYKEFANRLALPDANGNQDASPPEVGNMVFIQNANAGTIPSAATSNAAHSSLLDLSGAVFVVTPSFNDLRLPAESLPQTAPIYSSELQIYAASPRPSRAQLEELPGDVIANPVILEPVRWIEDRITRVTIKTESNRPAILTLADQYYPGWLATVDGKPVPITRSNEPASIFRAVAVPSGSHTVEFRYVPISFRLGLYLACFAIFVLCAFGAANRRAKPVSSMGKLNVR